MIGLRLDEFAIFVFERQGIEVDQPPVRFSYAEKGCGFGKQEVIGKAKDTTFSGFERTGYAQKQFVFSGKRPIGLRAVDQDFGKFDASGCVALRKTAKKRIRIVKQCAFAAQAIGIERKHHAIEKFAGAIGISEALRDLQRLLIFEHDYVDFIEIARGGLLFRGSGKQRRNHHAQHEKGRQHQGKHADKQTLLLHADTSFTRWRARHQSAR